MLTSKGAFKILYQTDRILNSKGMTYETTIQYGRGT